MQLLWSGDALHEQSPSGQRLRQMWLLCAIKDMDSPLVACSAHIVAAGLGCRRAAQCRQAPCLLAQTESCLYDSQHQSSSGRAPLHACLRPVSCLPRGLHNFHFLSTDAFSPPLQECMTTSSHCSRCTQARMGRAFWGPKLLQSRQAPRLTMFRCTGRYAARNRPACVCSITWRVTC